MQQHQSRESNAVETNARKSLYKKANKAIIRISIGVVSLSACVSRAARELATTSAAHAAALKKPIMARLNMLRRLAAYGNFAVAGFTAALTLHELAGRAPREAARIIEPARLTLEDHWQRVTGVIEAAVASLQRIKSMHAAAARQLDSADYALTQLLHDLRPVMALPTDVSGLRAILAEAERTAPRARGKALAAA